MGRAGSCCGLWELEGLMPRRNGLNVLTLTAQPITRGSRWDVSQESKYSAVAQCKFQELIKALSEEETLSLTKWEDQWSRIQF